jgi:glucosamine--fructose-6-phosphate aminotransferase (isomerizing)
MIRGGIVVEIGAVVDRLIADQSEGWTVALQHARPLPVAARHLFVGSGSSYYAAQAAAEVAWRRGIRVYARPAADVCLEPGTVLDDIAHVVVISRSGETSEAVWAAENAKRGGREVTGLSANPASGLMKTVHRRVAHEAWEDHTVVMIRSFTSFLVYLQACVALTEGASGPSRAEMVWRLPDMFAAAYQAGEPLLRQWQGQVPRRIVLLGAGVRLGIAYEGMLKLTEMSHIATFAYNPMEFRHGPRGALGPDDLVVLLGQVDMADAEGALLRELRQQTPHLAAIASSRWFEAAGALPDVIACTLPTDVDDLWAGPLVTVPLQRLAWVMAMQSGHDPDHPDHLDKVVRLNHG